MPVSADSALRWNLGQTVQDIDGMPGSGAPRTLQTHRYGSFEENGDEDSDEEDAGRAYEMVRTGSPMRFSKLSSWRPSTAERDPITCLIEPKLPILCSCSDKCNTCNANICAHSRLARLWMRAHRPWWRAHGMRRCLV